MNLVNIIKKELNKIKDPEKAKILKGFFKTGKGDYGERDVFLGIRVPDQRKIAKKYWKKTSFEDVEILLQSKIHDYRFVALVILIEKYEKGDRKQKGEIYNFYLKNRKSINNWDLVDTTAPKILGDYLLKRKEERVILRKLSFSDNLWDRRMAIISTITFIKNNQFRETFIIAKNLLNDDHDLIHKAVGWMLREIGKRNQKIEEEFLRKHYKEMPRTMLRYAIEKFPEIKRKFYLKKN